MALKPRIRKISCSNCGLGRTLGSTERGINQSVTKARSTVETKNTTKIGLDNTLSQPDQTKKSAAWEAIVPPNIAPTNTQAALKAACKAA